MKKLIWVLLLALCIAVPAGAALVNVSEGKTATASSLWSGTNANMAIDGVLFPQGWPVYHSNNGDFNPWWMVDMESLYLVKEVVIWNRSSCCQVRLQDITVEILDPAQGVTYVSPLLNPGNELSSPDSITFTLDVPVPGQYVRVRRTPYATDGHDGFVLSSDEIQVFATDEGASQAWGPLPGAGAVEVALDAALLWNTSVITNPDNTDELIPNPEVIKHIVYLSQDSSEPNDFIVIAQIDTGDPVDSIGETGALALVRDSVYYWRVDEIILDSNSNEVPIEGIVWSFVTLTSQPEIDSVTPVDQLIEPGDPAIFEVFAVNPLTEDATGLSYEWFKVDSAGDLAIGDNSSILAIADPNESNEGKYYCIVTVDSSGKSSTSRSANLTIKRLVHHWPFEGDSLDIAGGAETVVFGTPDFSVEGITGNYAIDLNGIAPDDIEKYISVTNSDSVKLRSGQYTVSAYVNVTERTNQMILIHGLGCSTWASWYLSIGGSENGEVPGRVAFGIRSGNGGANDRVASSDEIALGTWVHVAGTYDGELLKLYVNGAMVDSLATSTIPFDSAENLYFGADPGCNGRNFFDGKLDDVRIYNYALDPMVLAYMYHNTTGGNVCVQELRPEFDLNDDCMTTLVDIAILALNWMECNRVPASQCE